MDHPRESDARGTAMGSSALEAFVAEYPPRQTRPVGEAFLEYAESRLPQTLVESYRRFGLGWFGEQELEVVDPAEWMPVVQTWLGPDAVSTPFAVTSFGHVYHLDASGRVQCLDPHFLTNTVVADSVDDFFGAHLLSETSHLSDLRGPHQGAVAKLGVLAPGELYSFEPMLPLGGVVSAHSLVKTDGVGQVLLTHRLVREARRQ